METEYLRKVPGEVLEPHLEEGFARNRGLRFPPLSLPASPFFLSGPAALGDLHLLFVEAGTGRGLPKGKLVLFSPYWGTRLEVRGEPGAGLLTFDLRAATRERKVRADEIWQHLLSYLEDQGFPRKGVLAVLRGEAPPTLLDLAAL